MDLKHLQSYVAVVKYGSFTKAAENLFISQPTISAHINALEEELGKPLMIRTTKNMEITEKGKEVYEYATNVLDLCDRMVETCNEQERQTIHLGTSNIPSCYILPELLPEYAQMHPDTYFDIHQSDSQGVIDGLLDGIFDVGLIGMKEDKLKCEMFWQDRMVLVTPVNEHFLKLQSLANPIALDDSASPSEQGSSKNTYSIPNEVLSSLLKEPIIIREEGSGSNKSVNYFLEMIGMNEKELRVVACVNDQETIKNLVAAGLGISIISEKAARGFVENNQLLQFELPAYNGRELYLAYRKNPVMKPQVSEFIKYVQEKYN